MDTPPTFGTVPEGFVARDRPAAYAVIAAADGRVAAIQAEVRGRTWFWLPGGGSLPGEAPEETALREIREELGREARLAGRTGAAVQRFYAADEDRWYEMRAVFFAAEFAEEPSGPAESELHWVDPVTRGGDFFHPCHAWAASGCQASAVPPTPGPTPN